MENNIKSKKELLNELYNKMTNEIDKKMVFGDGNPDSQVLFLGEAPGGDEVKQGKPFVGKAGKNLDSFLRELNLTRNDCYISNAVKYRPTKISERGNVINATPTKEDIEFFRQYLIKEINIINPEIIITLGGIPAKSILNSENIIMSVIHGKKEYSNEFNCSLFHLYHPASVIYNNNLMSTYKNDLEKLNLILKNL